ncbi:hypothetical protein GDO78_022582 [Eleutherodactylus coqui]|uniref:Uncharacterized protein n=2 Tax=Eleutherodactylus coqui TaxID=57060 RepID=A0A8J6EGG5_ELECQ|nr:hypothetical protein GDO78_022582 [Eleutherodactylus coqui]
MVSGGNDTITVLLDITYNKDNTERRSLSSRLRPTVFRISATFITGIAEEDDGKQTGHGNGEPALRSAPLCALILLALLPVLLLK